MLLYLIREQPHGEALRGTLTADRQAVCTTLERTSKAIPEGIYRIRVNYSPHFRRVLPLLYFVPGRSGIRIHRGTRPQHSEGCILVPPDKEQEVTRFLLEAEKSGEENYIEVRARERYCPEDEQEEEQ